MIDKKILGVIIGVVLVLVFTNASQAVIASSSGLKVYVYVHGAASNAVGNSADVTVTSSQGFSLFRSVTVPQANFYVLFTFDAGEVDVGERVVGCVQIESTNQDGCGETHNSEDKRPERIDIYLNSGNINNQGGRSCSSSSSSSANDGSASSSSSSSSKSCLMFC
jgi:hypothetical protein